MLQDYVRTGTYYAAVIENCTDFVGRVVVVDVDAGSDLFCHFWKAKIFLSRKMCSEKTLAFLIPAVEKLHQIRTEVIVICPTRELAIQGVADRVCLSLSPTSEGSSVTVARALSIFHTWKHCGGALMRKLIKHNQPLKSGYMDAFTESVEGLQCDLPFEFQVLEIALKVVCTYLDSSVADLERNAYSVLDELVRNFSTKNLEHVRSLKSNLTSLLARVQKVLDEIEHLLDENEDVAHLYLTRKWIQSQQFEAYLAGTTSNSIVSAGHQLRHLSSNRSGSLLLGNHFCTQLISQYKIRLQP
ncbi:Magnesium transporter MRS2-4 [Camellia lanceoleosa]|uniref:Magnesium transporter MRS2-4 n=1 Tax=Camellia lanceoleosa TaxID=1840588 RepID=A0ACC0GCD4_9ERIC|nr:Magnesium transporter MRS2-4 [Camellia lanceoleosa]